MKKLSVIVPIYNVEKYLKRCIDSIVNQTYKNLEIILVDDGSKDKSGNICDEYSNIDKRIKVVHLENGGVSRARNVGINLSTGEYLGFVDSDDYISSEMYENMIHILENHNLDIVSCNAYMVKNNRVIGEKGTSKLKIYGKNEILPLVLQDYNNTVWDKVYKREVFDGVKFPEGRVFEDNGTAHLIFNNVKKVGILDEKYYYYFRTPNSITQTAFNVKSRYDCFLGYKDRLEFAKKNNIPCLAECKSLLVKSALSCLTAVYASNNEKTTKVYKDIEKCLLNFREDKDAYCLLNIKYKIYLWCFDRFDFIHILGAKLSKLGKVIKKW